MEALYTNVVLCVFVYDIYVRLFEISYNNTLNALQINILLALISILCEIKVYYINSFEMNLRLIELKRKNGSESDSDQAGPPS